MCERPLGKGVCACVWIAEGAHERVMSSNKWCISPRWLWQIQGNPIFSRKEHKECDISPESNRQHLLLPVVPRLQATGGPPTVGPWGRQRSRRCVSLHCTLRKARHRSVGAYSVHGCTRRCDWNPERLLVETAHGKAERTGSCAGRHRAARTRLLLSLHCSFFFRHTWFYSMWQRLGSCFETCVTSLPRTPFSKIMGIHCMFPETEPSTVSPNIKETQCLWMTTWRY